MPKTDAGAARHAFDDYAPVADRITLFYARYPTGRIITELVQRSEAEVVFRALVFRGPDEPHPAATGWAAERVGDGDINTVACIENTETSAVGRALANLGLTASRNRPSLEEMEKAARARALREPAPPRFDAARVEAARVEAARVEAARVDAPRMDASRADPARQRLADRLTDVLALLDEAERAGLSGRRVRLLRDRLLARGVPAGVVEQSERALRQWLAERSERSLGVVGLTERGAVRGAERPPAPPAVGAATGEGAAGGGESA